MILLVEDNPDDEELTIRALKANKVLNDIVVARDGEEAAAFLFDDAKKELPQLILLDLKLPKIDGLEILRRLRENERTKLVPVVILTSSNEEVDLARGYSLGANSFVRKPVDFTEFMDSVKKLSVYWLVVNETPPSGKAF